MEFLRFNPECSGLWSQLRYCPNDHPKKMLRFTRFLPTRSNAFQKLLFRNCVVNFAVVCADACRCRHKLTDDTICQCVLRNRFSKVDDRFTESRRTFLQIVSAPCLRFFTDDSRILVPKGIFDPGFSVFGFRHSFVLRHSRHALKKKIPVNTAFMTSIASKDCTTAAVVA